MKTPMVIFNDVMKKKNKKNRKGFSLVELIVVLVIMAILAAALVPTLIAYINQTRQSNSKNEAAACVQAAQTIASSAYADPDGEYYSKTNAGVHFDPTAAASATTFNAEIETLAEVNSGTVSSVTIANGVVTKLTYTAPNGDVVAYDTGASPMYSVT